MKHQLATTKAIAVAIALLSASLGHAETGLESFPRWAESKLAGTGSPPLDYEMVPAYPQLKFTLTVDLDRWPIEQEPKMVALDLTGRAWIFADDAAVTERQELLAYPGAGPVGKRGGGVAQTYSLVFDPEFPERPYLYVSSNRREGDWGVNRVSRFTVNDPTGQQPACDPDSELSIVEWPSKGHNGCDLKFGADGMLYISSGDGEAPADPANIGQVTDNLLSSILRLDVRQSSSDKPYSVPDDNPFTKTSGIRPEVWAYGLRNPWKMTFAPDGETIFLGDNGDEHWELVRRVTAATNHGWSAFEGSHVFRLSNALGGPVTELTIPAYEHPHSDMRSVIGGVFYQGEAFPQLARTYLYGCYFTGKVWALDFNAETQALTNPRRIGDTRGQLVAFGIDHHRELLVATLDGAVMRLQKRKEAPVEKPIPSKLSATGLFESTAGHRPAVGVLPYGINASAWFDGAEKTRWMAVPESDKSENIDAPIGERLHKSWRFPNGSAFVQTLWFEDDSKSDGRNRVETQISYKDSGEWRFLTYRWNDDQSDADLVDENGVDAQINIDGHEMPWRFASRAECTACHTQRSFFTNGLSSEQMMRGFDYSEVGGVEGDQLETLIHLGLFNTNREPARPNAKPAITALADPHDEAASLDKRARAYLHANCAHCHRETGLGGRAPFELLHWLALDDCGVLDTLPMVGLPGVENARVIAPREPGRSEIVRRMEATEAGRMPLIGSRIPDTKGIDLISKWIESLPVTATPAKP